MKHVLIAPCGMNCELCIGHIREKNKCPGCNAMNEEKKGYIRKCTIKNCQILKAKDLVFCSVECEKYTCLRLKNLDKRYRTKYGMSMIENLENIHVLGLAEFIETEQSKWKCPECGELLCVHRTYCLYCGKIRV
jgi:hypothetical protein